MIKNNIFKSVREAEAHAAYQVACFWLQSADRILSREDASMPMKLSKCGLELSASETDRDIYRPFNGGRGVRLNISNIRRDALQLAMAKLLAGQFPRVAGHFSVSAAEPDVMRQHNRILARSGEVEVA